MSNSLLTTDTHFTDTHFDYYRWDLFSVLEKLIAKYQVKTLYILGDLTDRKDRHSSHLVNRLAAEFACFLEKPPLEDVYVLMGNHDQPLKGVPFWEFLHLLKVHYITEPVITKEGVALLPFNGNPVKAWEGLQEKFKEVKAIMMHQTVEGSVVEGGRVLPSGHPVPEFPKGIPVFSGDVHRPQKVKNITYVGAPYPVRFSETWANRVFVIENDNFKKPIDIPVRIIKRAILDVESVDELKKLLVRDFKPNDQIKVRYKLITEKMKQWPVEQDEIRKVTKEASIELVSLEAVLNDEIKTIDGQQQGFELMKPSDVIKEFAKEASLDETILDEGLEILKEVEGC